MLSHQGYAASGSEAVAFKDQQNQQNVASGQVQQQQAAAFQGGIAPHAPFFPGWPAAQQWGELYWIVRYI
jgi:hypothetical protein